jgi:Cu-processing system ATP-binding protein
MSGTRVDVMRLQKRFGRKQVLRGVDLTIAPDRITALVGPNSAGKTTLLKCLLGMVRPDPGSAVLIDGEAVNGGPEYRSRIGYMPQAARFPEQLTGRELLRFLVELRDSPADRDEALIEAFALEPQLDKPIRTLSGGTRQKLNAVAAFLFRPALLILDEPTAGLDPVAASVLKDRVLQAPAQGTTVLLTSHLMAEVEELAQDVLFLAEGRIAFAGTVESLLRESGETKLERAIARLLSRAAA